jgi:hypothetical protein
MEASGANGDGPTPAVVDDGLDKGELRLVDVGGGLLRAGEEPTEGQHLEDGLH